MRFVRIATAKIIGKIQLIKVKIIKSVDCRKNGTKRRGGTKMTKQELIKALEVQKGVLEEVKVHIENIEQEIEKLDKE